MNTKYLIISLVLALFTVSVSAYALNVEDSILCDDCGMYYENTFEYCPYCESSSSSVEDEVVESEPVTEPESEPVTEPESVTESEPESVTDPELDNPVIEDDGSISGEITDPVTGERLTVDLSPESIDMLATTLAADFVPSYAQQYDIVSDENVSILIDTNLEDFLSSDYNIIIARNAYNTYKLYYSSSSDRYVTGTATGSKTLWYFADETAKGSYVNPYVFSFSGVTSYPATSTSIMSSYFIVWANVDVVAADGTLIYDSSYDASGGTVTPVCTCTDRCTTSDYDATCPVCSNDIAGCTGEVIEPDPECICEDRCTVDNVNADCPVCSESIDGCLGEAVTPDPEPDPDPEPVYTITFVTGFDDVVIGARYSDTFVAPRPYKAGYMFTGWYLDEDLTQPYTTDYVFTADTVLYASWSDAPIMVSFQEGIFDSLVQLLSCEPVVYVLSLMGMVFIFGIVRKFVIPLIT